MKKLVSPIELGDTVCTGVLAHVPIVRQLVHGTEWQRYFTSVRRQILTRGRVPDAVWMSERRCRAARKVEGVLSESVWGDDFTFHPTDPFFVVGGWEFGDLSEIESLMDIEESFGVHLDPWAVAGLLKNGLTFGDFVDYVLARQEERNKPQGDAGGRTTNGK